VTASFTIVMFSQAQPSAMDNLMYRLSSFSRCLGITDPGMPSASSLACRGFYYDSSGDSVVCYGCQKKFQMDAVAEGSIMESYRHMTSCEVTKVNLGFTGNTNDEVSRENVTAKTRSFADPEEVFKKFQPKLDISSNDHADSLAVNCFTAVFRIVFKELQRALTRAKKNKGQDATSANANVIDASVSVNRDNPDISSMR
jgi:Inhibitor of Apoptosis domain